MCFRFIKSLTLKPFQVISAKTYRFKISAKIDAADKTAMVEALRNYENLATNDEHPRTEVESPSTELPPLQYLDDHEGWSTFEGPILYFYAGKGPYVSRYKSFQLLQLFSPLSDSSYSSGI